MIQTATLSPTLPTPARSTTVQNGPTPGDFAGSFAQANDDAAANGAPTTSMPIVAIPASSPGTIIRQDAAATGNTLPTPAAAEDAQALVPKVVALLAVPLAPNQRPISLAPIAPANSAIPAEPELAAPNVATKCTVIARPTIIARAAAFAAPHRSGKAKLEVPTTPSDDTTEALPTDQPTSPGLTAVAQPAIGPPPIDPPAIALPLVEASSDVLPVAPLARLPRTEDTQAIEADDAVALAGSAIGGAQPIGTNAVPVTPLPAPEPNVTAPTSTPTTPGPTPSRKAARIARAEPAVPTTIGVAPPAIAQIPVSRPVVKRPVVQPGALPVATISAGPALEMADPSRTAPRQGTPATGLPVENSPSQIAALTAAVPVAPVSSPMPSGVIPSLGLTIEQGSTAPSTGPASVAVPLAIAADAPPVATPRWVATDATTPVALALAQPTAVQPQPGTVASASQVFGAAIQAAKARDERDTADPTAPSLAASALVSPLTIKTAEAQQAPLDMRQDRWPHAMIARIELLRDAADATDTRIRLIPDALGAIDVSLKRDGDTVRVHFHAEQSATRTLLQDAQPRLVELAEARGLKLAQGSLGQGPPNDGAANNGQHRPSATPQAPTRTTASPAVDAALTEDTRIA